MPHRNAGMTVALVDDEEDFRLIARASLEQAGFKVYEFTDAERCLAHLGGLVPDVICLDLDMPGMGGLAALREIKKALPDLPVLVVSSGVQVPTVVSVIQAGAYDFLAKPFDPVHFVTRVRQAATERVQALRIYELERDAGLRTHKGLVGQSPPMRGLYRSIDRVATSDVTVLLSGESGTGKEVVAQAIHAASKRAAGPFVAVNCAAVPESLQESEFFGHERGAFTGATERRIGLFEQAHNGTLFLDEVAELSLALQAKLLRVLQERQLRRVGGGLNISSDFRIVAASHSDLEEAIAAGRFRQDLFYRIAVFELQVPPLRQRGNDIALLARQFVLEIAEREGRVPPSLSSDFIGAIESYGWPGNVRELQNAVHRALVRSSHSVLTATDLPDRVLMRSSLSSTAATRQVTMVRFGLNPEGLATWDQDGAARSGPPADREVIAAAIERAGGNLAKAARLLGMGRTTLYRRLQTLHLDPKSLAP